MNNKEKINSSKIDLVDSNGHDNNSHDNNGHDDHGHDNNGHNDNEHTKIQAITENICDVPTNTNKYKKVPPDVFLEILKAKLQNPDEIDDDLNVVLTLLKDLEDSIQLVRQLTNDNGTPCFSALYQHHYERAVYLSKFFDQFLWFSQLKKNPRFDFSTIENNGHNNSKKK